MTTAKSKLKRSFIATIIVSILPITSTFAEDTELAASSGWQLNKFTYAISDDETGEGRVLFTSDTTANGALFHCKRNKLQVMLSLEPIAIHDVIGDIGLSRAMRAEIQIGNDDAFKESWVLLRRNKVAVPRNPFTARKLFNAAANDEPITLSIGKYNSVLIDPPAAAADLFNEFVEACALAG